MPRTTVAQLEERIDALQAQIQRDNEALSAQLSELVDAKLAQLKAKAPEQASLPGIEANSTDNVIAFRKMVTNRYGDYYNVRLNDDEVTDQDIAASLGINVRRIDRHIDRAGRVWANVYPS